MLIFPDFQNSLLRIQRESPKQSEAKRKADGGNRIEGVHSEKYRLANLGKRTNS